MVPNIEGNRVLVTGGAGFIGSELAGQLAEYGATVLVVDNLVNGRRENLNEIRSGRVQLYVEDIRNKARMRELLDGINTVFHLACLGVRHSIHSPLENHDVNATATLDLLAISREVGVQRFVYVSSSEVYGPAKWAPMSEEHPTYPMTVYGASKLAGECYIRSFFHCYGYPTVVVRPFNSYGPRSHHEGDCGEVIPRCLLRCMTGRPMIIFGDGTQTRDFTFVSDTARGILLAGYADRAIGHTINLGQGKEITINSLAKKIAKLVGRHDAPVLHREPRPGDVLRLCADSTSARKLLGFEPSIDLEDGLRRLHDWYEVSDRTAEELLEDEVLYNWKQLAQV